MSISHVVDASVAIKLFFQEGDPEPVRLAMARSEWRIAPDLLFLEFANVALKKIKQGLASRDEARSAVASLSHLIDEIATSHDLSAPSLELAAEHGFTVYDASYLVLAEMRGGSLLTADAKLARRAQERGLSGLIQLVG